MTLLVYATNTGDQSVESRTLIDNVKEIPEPATMMLLGLGLLGLGAARRRRAY